MHLLLSLLLNFCAHATTPPGLDPVKFTALAQRAVEKGTLLQAGDYDLHVLTRRTPDDPANSHLAEYFSAVGVTQTDGKFVAFRVSAVSEDWRKQPNGDWEIEQWVWDAALDGEPLQIFHTLLKEDARGSVLSDVNLPVGQPTDKAEIQRWEKYVGRWE